MSIKVMMIGRRRTGQTLSEHRTHMKDVHGKLVVDYIGADPVHAPRRYVQNHIFDGIYPGGDGLPHSFKFGLDFVTELTFPDLKSLKISRETPFYLTHLKPDEPRMADTDNVLAVPATEETFKVRSETSTHSVKVFVFWHDEAPAIADLASALGGTWETVAGCSRSTPVTPAPATAIDSFWLDDDTAATAFAIACREQIQQQLAPKDIRFSIAVAREYVLHAG